MCALPNMAVGVGGGGGVVIFLLLFFSEVTPV
jgi:hypothetical protein